MCEPVRWKLSPLGGSSSRCYPATFPIHIYVSIDNTSKLNSANIDHIATHSEG